MWNISVSQDTNNTAYTECFDLSITNKENNINLDNAYPISNDKGKSLTPYTFTITNTCDITAQYSVNLEVLRDSTLSSNFIDLMINNSSIRLLKSFTETKKVNTDSIESRKISYGYLKSGESVDYSLRLWIDYDTTMEDLNNETKIFKSKIVVVGEPIKDGSLTTNNFDYTGTEQVFTAKTTGYYKLETWGAEGGFGITGNIHSQGGYGGFSEGKIYLKSGEKLYINVGQSGVNGEENYTGDIYNISYLRTSYNGGGAGAINENCNWGGGGGATHIAKTNGLLSNLETIKNDILITSAGGGGGGICTGQNSVNSYQNGASAGGFVGNSVDGHCGSNEISPTGGTQTEGGKNNSGTVTSSFGQGSNLGSGGGGGLYGGSGGWSCGSGAGGGSSYIGNLLLTNKVMYCYNCQESTEENTKTISTTCNEETPTENCAKKGNGYARITLISVDENEENSIKSTIMSQLDTTGKCPVANADGNVTVTSIESTNSLLCSTQDNYGTSYYYRGNVMNNYVKFANLYWRIVRINGDGSIRLVYDGTSAHANGEASNDRVIGTSAFNIPADDNAYVGYMYGTTNSSTYAETHANINDSTVKKFIGELDYYFQEAVKIEYEYYVQKERAKEEQRAIREQMRQEAEERRELERQQKQIEKEESKYHDQISQLTEQMQQSADDEKNALLQARIEELQKQLAAVAEQKDKIVELQNGKAGNVYVISNIGSFGEGVFKIGMTRRLEPMERVNELGSASVPFPFDVHSMIFSDDAVSLETRLHHILKDQRVNKVNLRKEFFRVSLDDLEKLVGEIAPTADFKRTALAEQYRQSLSITHVSDENSIESDDDEEDADIDE